MELEKIRKNGIILVTGGCGFIGANLVPLLEKNGYRVRVLDNLSRGNEAYLKGTSADICVGDIRNRDVVSKALGKVEAVVHLAAYGSVVESVEVPEENFDVNVNGTFAVLDECRKRNVKQFIFASTGGALMGNSIPPVDELSLPRPISPYGSSKLCGEGYCCSYAESYEMDITILRFANVIGPWSAHKKGAATAFIRAIIRGAPIIIYGNGTATRDFLFVDDLCKGILTALQMKVEGFNVFHLASGREVSIKELADLIKTIAGKKNHPIEFSKKRKGEVDRNFANCEKAQRELGFSPRFSLEKGMESTWGWFTSCGKDMIIE